MSKTIQLKTIIQFLGFSTTVDTHTALNVEDFKHNPIETITKALHSVATDLNGFTKTTAPEAELIKAYVPLCVDGISKLIVDALDVNPKYKCDEYLYRPQIGRDAIKYGCTVSFCVVGITAAAEQLTEADLEVRVKNATALHDVLTPLCDCTWVYTDVTLENAVHAGAGIRFAEGMFYLDRIGQQDLPMLSRPLNDIELVDIQDFLSDWETKGGVPTLSASIEVDEKVESVHLLKAAYVLA